MHFQDSSCDCDIKLSTLYKFKARSRECECISLPPNENPLSFNMTHTQCNGKAIYPSTECGHSKIRLNPCLIFLAFIYAIIWTWHLTLRLQSHIFIILILSFVGICIASLAISFIRTTLKTQDVEWSFLINQFLLISIPLKVIIFLISLHLQLNIILFWFKTEFDAIRRYFEQLRHRFMTIALMSQNNDEASSQMQKIIELWDSSISHSAYLYRYIRNNNFPKWKLIASYLCICFIAFGFVHQTVRWFVARRVKGIYVLRSIHGILSSSYICGLATAYAQFNVSVILFSILYPDGSSYLKWRTLMDGLLAFPFYIGTMLFIGTASASEHINHQIQSQSNLGNIGNEDSTQYVSGPTVLKSWFLMVMLDGLYNTANYLPIVLSLLRGNIYTEGNFEIPISYLTIGVAQFVLVVLFCVAVKRRLESVLQRQFMLKNRSSIPMLQVKCESDQSEMGH